MKKLSKKTLLEKAKSIPGHSRFMPIPEDEEVELGLAWLRGEVTDAQLAHGYGLKDAGSVVSKVARIIRRMVKLGRIVITQKAGR